MRGFSSYVEVAKHFSRTIECRSFVVQHDWNQFNHFLQFNTKPKFAKSGFKHDAEISSGSEYDSGHDSGILPTEAASFCDKVNSDNSKPKTSSFIKTCRFVKLRSNKGGRGGANNSYTKTSMSSLHSSNTNSPSSPSQKKNIRASHCKSSGYESSAGERDSIDSVKGSLEPHGCNELVEINHGGVNTKLQNKKRQKQAEYDETHRKEKKAKAS